MAEVDTIPKLVKNNAEQWGNKPAMCMKNLGIWQKYTWSDYYGTVKYFGLGLLSLGTKPADRVAKMGIARTFQNIELYSGLTTLENLMAARHIFMKQNFLTGGAYFGPAHKEEIAHRKIVEDIIDFLEIEPVRKKVVSMLPYGMRKRVELGRALALEPEVLLLDEPMAGMNLEEKEDIARFIVDIFEGQGETYPDTPILRDGVKCIVLIEHDMGVVMDLADRIAVLDFGSKIAEGRPEEIKNDEHVIAAYLGDE
ncbi:MAG: ATP-binding cassette domain-containing protein [Dehalococcoides mccartyi]|uniref:ABC transporter ATP-binding protein n=1 Tax=Dehalococcoides mccartyi TaxID=61435 RepID=UPI0030FBEAC7